MSHRSITRDNTNSQGLILRVYPTIKHRVTKSSYFLGLSLGLSLFTMGDAWALELFWCWDTNWCCCTVHFVLTGASGLTVDIFSHTCRGALSLRSILGTHAGSWRFLLFTTVHLPSPFAISSSLSGWDDSGRWFIARHTRIDGIIWKFCFGVCNLSWDLYRSRLSYFSLWLEALRALVRALVCLLLLLFLFLLVLDPVTCAGQNSW